VRVFAHEISRTKSPGARLQTQDYYNASLS
jgi:hypothetical protein